MSPTRRISVPISLTQITGMTSTQKMSSPNAPNRRDQPQSTHVLFLPVSRAVNLPRKKKKAGIPFVLKIFSTGLSSYAVAASEAGGRKIINSHCLHGKGRPRNRLYSDDVIRTKFSASQTQELSRMTDRYGIIPRKMSFPLRFFFLFRLM